MDDELENEEKSITIDDAISYIGEFNKFQLIVTTMFAMVMFPATYQILIMVFSGLDPEWRCVTNSTICKENKTFSPQNSLRCTLPRSEWEYTQEKEYSLVTYFDVYCDDSWLIQLSSSIVFLGWCVGGIFVGWAADNYGRKNIIFGSITMVLVCGVITPFMPNIYCVIMLRFLVGFSTAGTNLQMAILLSEIVAFKYRSHAAVMVWIFFAIALCALSLKAYYIRNWKVLFIVCTVPYIFVLLFYKFTPESPRWLRLQGRLDELIQLFRKIARINDKELPKFFQLSSVKNRVENHKHNPSQLFSTFQIAKISLILCYGAFAHGMIFYGISMAASDLGGSLYLNFFLLSLIEIPAITSSIFICNKFGRKYPTIFGVTSAGISCVIVALLPMKIRIAKIVIAMIGKVTISISFNAIYLWAIELFPTALRAQGMGFVNAATRIGAGTAPWVISELTSLHHAGPYVCMSVAAFVCAALSFFLCDTNGLPTLETVEDFIIRHGENKTVEADPEQLELHA